VIRYDDIPASFNVTSHFLDRNVEEGRGGCVALFCGEEAVTYAELARLTNRIGNVLLDAGVRPEDRVLLALSDGPEFVATWYAVLKIGAVTAEVYTFLQPKDYAYYVEYTRARVVVADGTTVDKLREAIAGVRFPPQLLVVGESFDELVAEASDELEPAATTKDDIAIWKFTSGSTGAPKAAVHPAHDPLVSFECYARDVVGYREDDVVLPVPKLFFGYARDATTLFTFGVGGGGVVFPERSTPERIFDLVERHRPTILVQVPTMMSAMLAHPGAEERDLSSLRLCLSSGEALPEAVHRRWLDLYGVEVLEGVGSSELYHIYLSNRPQQVRPGSAGELVPGYRAVLTDGEGAEVPSGAPGELRVAGESAALLYWGDHEKSKRTFSGDWVRTGDLFEQDADGYFWYRGRADDLLKVGGIWVAPLEIETCLLHHAAVKECAVLGVEHGGLTLPRAYVVLRGAAPSDDLARELQDFVRARLSPYKYPREVEFVRELPKTASGKVDRRTLRETEAARA
jgi:benzoate-CoA ligase family protein